MKTARQQVEEVRRQDHGRDRVAVYRGCDESSKSRANVTFEKRKREHKGESTHDCDRGEEFDRTKKLNYQQYCQADRIAVRRNLAVESVQG